MPLHDYVCYSCGAVNEILTKVSGPEPKFCPTCGTEDSLDKELGAPSFHLKGSGWAKDSYSSAPSKKGTKD